MNSCIKYIFYLLWDWKILNIYSSRVQLRRGRVNINFPSYTLKDQMPQLFSLHFRFLCPNLFGLGRHTTWCMKFVTIYINSSTFKSVHPYEVSPSCPVPPSVESQNVTNKSCLLFVKSEKYAFWVTLRLIRPWQFCALAHLGCTREAGAS